MQLHGTQVRRSAPHGAATPRPHHATFRFAKAHGGRPATAQERHRQLTEQTGKWVAQTFFGQMLKQMRDSPFKSKLFDGGHGGEAFQQMADQRLADHMARGAGHRLVDAIVSKIEGSRGATNTATAAVTAAARTTARATTHDWGHA